jgi:zinc protease
VSVLKEDFDKGLEALADVLTHPSFPQEEIEKQRRDTLLAIRRIDESWEREVQRLFLKRYYGSHPYGNDLIGTKTSIQAMTRDDIMAFYRRLVVANNTALAIFGDIDPDGIAKRVASAFRDLRTGEIEEPQRVTKRPKLSHDDEIEKLTDRVSAALFVGYDGLTISDSDRPVMDVMDAIVSGVGYPSGWLHESLRGGTQSLVYYVHAYPSYGVDAGHFGVITQTTLGNYDEVLDIILQKMERLRTDLVSEEELGIGKNVVVTMHQLGRETIAAQAYEAALWEVLGLGFDWGERYTRMINEVKREDILRVAQRCFQHRLVASIIPREPVEAVIPPEGRERMHVH